MQWIKRAALFVWGYAAGFASMLLLVLIFGSYEAPVTDTPAVAEAQAVAPVVIVTPTTVPQTAPALDAVLNAFTDAGIQLRDIDYAPKIQDGSPIPRSFRINAAWNDALLGEHGGQVFICDSPDLCVAISSYFQMFVGLAGPYIYTSPSGLVVLQLNSGFTPDQAALYRDALKGF